jgi:hypothetical protein
MEVTQRNKPIDTPWPELHTNVSYAVTPSLAVSPHARRRGGGTRFCRHAFDGYAMGVKNQLRCLRDEHRCRSLGRETVPRESRRLDADEQLRVTGRGVDKSGVAARPLVTPVTAKATGPSRTARPSYRGRQNPVSDYSRRPEACCPCNFHYLPQLPENSRKMTYETDAPSFRGRPCADSRKGVRWKIHR